MSGRVRFSVDRPGVTYVPSLATGTGLVAALFSQPMPSVIEHAYNMDIHTAASIGEANFVQELIRKGVAVNGKNFSGWTPLHYAAYLGHHNVSKILLDNGALLEECNRKGQTALMMAAACGNLQVVRSLVEHNASTDRADRLGRQALHYAASCSQNVVADVLLAAGADANAKDESGMTPTLEACLSAHELTILSLIEKGGDHFLKNNRGEDGLAMVGDNPKLIQLLKECKRRSEPTGGYVVEPSSAKPQQPRSLEELLDAMHLTRYLPRLEGQNLDLVLFFSLTEKDLDEMGIAYGPKKKMLSVIERYKSTGVISTEGYDNRQTIGYTQQPPPPYEPPSSSNSIHTVIEGQKDNSDVLNSLRFVRKTTEITKQMTIDAMEAAVTKDNERLLELLRGILENMDSIDSNLIRHPM